MAIQVKMTSFVQQMFVYNEKRYTFQSLGESQKDKRKSPERATCRSRSQPQSPGGREKVTQINVCIANKQMHHNVIKHTTSCA